MPHPVAAEWGGEGAPAAPSPSEGVRHRAATHGSGSGSNAPHSPSPTQRHHAPLPHHTDRLPSVTPPKPPPPYSSGPCLADAEARNVRSQILPHFRAGSGADSIGMKYEAAVTEAAALRRQVHCLKLQLARPSQLGAAGEPLPVAPVDSPQASPRRDFASAEEEEMWQAMDIDVATKLEAIDKVARIRQEYEDTQRELQQELVVKEEVLAMLTEQLKGMVDKGQVAALRSELQAALRGMEAARRERDAVASERDAKEEHLKHVAFDRSEVELNLEAAVKTAVAETQASFIDEIQDLNAELDKAREGAAAAGQAHSDLAASLRSAEAQLCSAEGALGEQRAQLEGFAEVQEQLARSEDVVQQLADSLQAQALAHKQALEEAQEREVHIEGLAQKHSVSSEAAASLQRKLDERDRRHEEMRLHVEEREKEVRELQSQLDGFTAHLQGHLLQKDEQMRRSQESLVEEVKMLKVAVMEGDARAGVAQSVAAAQLEEAQAETRARAARVAELETLVAALERAGQDADRLRRGTEDNAAMAQDIVQRKLADVGSELASQQHLTERLQEELKERDNLLLQQQETITALQEKIDACESIITAHEETEHRNKVLAKTTLELQVLLTAKEEEHAESLKGAHEVQQQSNDTMERLSDRLDVLEQRNRDLQAQVDAGAAKAESEASRADAEAARAGRCEAELRGREGEVALLQGQLEEREAQRSSSASQAQTEMQTMKESLGWISQNLEQVSAQLSDRDATIGTLRQGCEQKDADIAKLKALLQKSSETLDLLQECAEKSGEEQRQQLAQATRECNRLREEKANAEKAAAAAQAQVGAMQSQLREGCETEAGRRQAHEAEAQRLRAQIAESKSREHACAEREQQAKAAEAALLARLHEADSARHLQCDGLSARLAEAETELQARRGTEAHAALLEEQCRSREQALHHSQHINLALQEELTARALQQDAAHWFDLLSLRQAREADALAAVARDRKQEKQIADTHAAQAQLMRLDDECKRHAAARETELQELCATLRQRADESDASNRTARQLIERMTDELAQCDALLHDREAATCSARAEAHEARKRLEEERRAGSSKVQDRDLELAERDSLITRLRGARAELEAAASGKEKLLRELSHRMDTKSADVRGLHVALEESVQQVRVLRDQLAAQEAEALESKQRLVAVEEEHAQERNSFAASQDAAHGRVRGLEEELAARAVQLRESAERLAGVTQMLQRSDDESQTVRSALSACRGELGAATLAVQTAESERVRLQLQLDTLQRTNDEKEERLQEKHRDVARLRAEKDDAQSRSAVALSQLQTTDIQHIQTHNELLAELERARHAAKMAEGAQRAAQVQLRGLEEEHASDRARAERRTAALQGQALSLQAAAHEAQQAHEAALQAAGVAHSKELSLLRCDNAAKTTALQHMQGRLDTLQTSVSSSDSATQAERAIGEMAAEMQRLCAELASKEEALRAQSSVADMARTEGDQLREALGDEAARAKRVDAHAEELRAALVELRQQAAAGAGQVQRLCGDLAARYRSVEAVFCTPHVSPGSGSWDPEVAAEFIRAAKQWCIGYTALLPALEALATPASPPVRPVRHDRSPSLQPSLPATCHTASSPALTHRSAPGGDGGDGRSERGPGPASCASVASSDRVAAAAGGGGVGSGAAREARSRAGPGGGVAGGRARVAVARAGGGGAAAARGGQPAAPRTSSGTFHSSVRQQRRSGSMGMRTGVPHTSR